MELLGSIFTGIFTVFGAIILFILLVLLVTIGAGMYLWHRIKKRAQEVLRQELGNFKDALDETAIDVEGKEER